MLHGQKLSISEAQQLLPKLKEDYEKNKDKEIFKFQGEDILTVYAKYVIEYLESVLK